MAVTAPPGAKTPWSGSPAIPSARERRTEAARFRRSLTFVVLSAVAPGSIQLLAGNRRVGKIMLLEWLGLVVVIGLVLWLVPLNGLARLAVRPWLLNLFTLLTFAAALGWVAVILDAWRLGNPPGLSRRHRLVTAGVTLALAVLVATPFVSAAQYASAARDAVVAMFPSGDAAAASAGRLNVLLLGADAGKGREGVRPDSINVVSVDVQSGRPLLISLPRNLERARFPDDSPAAAEFPDGFSGPGDRGEWLLNATWTYGEAHPDLFVGSAGPGVTAVRQAVEGTLGLPIHYYVVIDLQGFRDLVDALGGVIIRVNESIPMGQDGRVLEPGLRKLDGYETLWYARSRTGSSDYARMSRQRCVLGAILHEADPATVLRNFIALTTASTSVVTTDIPQSELPDLVDLAWRAKDLPVTSLQLVPPLVTPSDPDFQAIADQVELAIVASVDGESDERTTGVTPELLEAPDSVDADAEQTTSEPPDSSDPGTPAVDLSSVCAYE